STYSCEHCHPHIIARGMAKIIECVPNFSEGRNKDVIDAISRAIGATPGVSLLDVDPGSSTNRTVYTFVGSPDDVVQGALNAAKTAAEYIDMRKHKGEHPRLGALDVCPFIPVSNATMDDCVQCANNFAKMAAEEIGIPVYLYGYASQQDYRKSVPQIRSGEYEGLAKRIVTTEWAPDYGPTTFNPKWGATIAGARKFLIAFNINILGTKEQAHRIALNLREAGRGPDKPGRLRHVQGMGWWLDEENIAQVSVNLLDHEITPMHVAYEESIKDAKELKVGVCGSQVVGLVPLDAMLKAADYYIEKDHLFIMEEDQKIRLVSAQHYGLYFHLSHFQVHFKNKPFSSFQAVERMGLSSIGHFDPKTRIIEYMIGKHDGPLASMSLKKFILSIGARTSAPGGGSAAAAVAAIGSGLGTMVGLMTYGMKKFESLDPVMRTVIPPLRQTMLNLIDMVDSDTSAFNDFMIARKLPQKTPEEKEIREKSLQNGLKKAVQVPMSVIETVNNVWDPLIELSKVSNITTASDLQ
ncbi:hypothetical protein QZH41_014145, partial [Actinostola sp. cb2023]